MEVKEIVVKWLGENGYDGLVDQDRDCGCQISDLMPCDEPCFTCEAGHERDAPPSTGYDFLIYPGKAQQQDSEDGILCPTIRNVCKNCGWSDKCEYPENRR